MAGLTSSSNRTVSPIIMVLPSWVGVKAAHEVRPMKGGIVQPSTAILRSLLGFEILKTFSSLLRVPFNPLAFSMAAVSSGGAECAGHASASDAATNNAVLFIA